MRPLFSVFLCTGNNNLLRQVLLRREEPLIVLDRKKKIEREMKVLLRYVPFKDIHYNVLYPISIDNSPHIIVKKLKPNERWMHIWWLHVGIRQEGVEYCDFSSNNSKELENMVQYLIKGNKLG